MKTWPPQLSRKFCKSKAFSWSYLKIWTGPIITIRNVHQNKAILIYSLENLTCPCNHELKFSQNTQHLMKWFKNLNYLYYHKLNFRKNKSFLLTELEKCPCHCELKLLLKRKFWWCHLNFWTGPIIKSWKFCKNKAVLMMSCKRLTCSCYHKLKFFTN